MGTSEGPLTFDDVLRQIGGTGPFQIIFFFITGLISMFSTETMFINFIAVDMPHWCTVKELEDLPFDVQKKVAIPSEDQDDLLSPISFSKCQMFNLNYSIYSTDEFLSWNRSAMTLNNPATIGCTDGWTFDRSEFASSAVSQYNLVCGSQWLVPLLGTAFTGGMFIGALSGGIIADKIGRRPALIMGMVVKLLGGILLIAVPGYIVMCTSFIIIGIGATSSFLNIFVLVVEVSVGKARAAFGTGLMITFSIGYMLIPVYSLAVRDFWRLSIVMVGPAILGIFLWWIIPESPRWLLVNKKFDQAENVIRYIAKVNNKPLADDFDASKISLDDDTEKADLPKRNLLDLFKRPTIRKWTLIVYLHWFTDSLVYFAMSMNSGNLAGNIFLNSFLLALVEIPANVILTFTLQWRPMGRRLSASFALLLAGATSLVSVPLLATNASPIATTVLSLFGKAGSSMGFSSAFVYTGEIFPTEVRNVAMGSASSVARVSGMLAPFVGGLLGNAWVGLPYMIYGIFGVAVGLLTLMLPETLGEPLCQTLEEAENRGKPKGPVTTRLTNPTEKTYIRDLSSNTANVNPAYAKETD